METIGEQVAAAMFVIGSYFPAHELEVKRPRRRLRKQAGPVAAQPAPERELSGRP